MTALTGTRNASLADMVEMLREQQAHKIDAVVPATAIRSRNGSIELKGVEPYVGDDGVTTVDGLYRPTEAADGLIASKLGIDVRYLRRLRREAPDLFDANVNGWLHGRTRVVGGEREVIRPADDRKFLLRLFASDGDEGVCRAFLSDRYGVIDNLDVLSAVMAGVSQAGVEIQIRPDGCNLTDSSMNVKAYSPQVAAMAPTFLKGYRNPFANPELEQARQEISRWQPIAEAEGKGYERGTEPVVFAGFRFSNSEIGAGAVALKPELFIQVCRNGLTLPAFGRTKAHLGARMDVGAWSGEAQRKNLELITLQARDKVREWLSPEFLEARVGEVEEAAGAPVTKPAETVKVLGKQLGFSEAEQDGILAHFIAGGQMTAGGFANALTSYSQTVPSVDRAEALDDLALKAMDLAAKAV